LSGRGLLPTDRIGTPNAMVVNDVFAREFFPGEDPLGKRVMVAGGRNPIDCVVVGVVDSARTEFVGRSPGPSVYLSANQRGLRSLRILIRSTLPPSQITETVRKLVARRNPDIPVEPLVSVETMIGDSLVSQRVTAATLTAFSVVALLLAALGLYGVLTHYVAQRTHEIGVRMSLGAQSRTIVAHVLTRSAWMVGPGIVIGLAAALAATRLVEDFLYGVPRTDPATFAAVSAGLALVAFAASAWPAWRASRVDPVRALRGE
jgi:ABC-type antimicrobial peptide transport system permease subunit